VDVVEMSSGGVVGLDVEIGGESKAVPVEGGVASLWVWKEGTVTLLKLIDGVWLEVVGVSDSGAGMHHSNSRLRRESQSSIPSCEIGQFFSSSHSIAFASAMASIENQQKAISPWK